jgi:hypothetical protein
MCERFVVYKWTSNLYCVCSDVFKAMEKRYSPHSLSGPELKLCPMYSLAVTTSVAVMVGSQSLKQTIGLITFISI